MLSHAIWAIFETNTIFNYTLYVWKNTNIELTLHYLHKSMSYVE